MSKPTEDLNIQIERLTPIINTRSGSLDFIKALTSLNTLAEKDLQQNLFFSLPRPKINWAPSLVKELAEALQRINDSDSLKTELPKLMEICEKYKLKEDITYPWAKILAILTLSTIGLIIGAPIGAVIGILAFFICTPFWATAAFDAGIVELFLISAAGILGAIAGAALGAQAGFQLGTFAVKAEFGELIDTIFYQEEHQILSQMASTVTNSIEAINQSVTLGF